MNIRNIVVPVLVLLTLAACSFDKQRIDYTTSADQVPPLEIPPDLTNVAANEQYFIPGASGVSAANFSDYSKGVAALPARGVGVVLPTLKNRHMERNGLQHWIVVEDTAENIWPGIKAFWLGMGFRVPVDNPQAGVMETDWLENHGNVPKSYVRRLQGNGKAIDILKSEGIRDQYVTRIERSKDGLSTEIHISCQSMRETFGNKKDGKWMPYEKDPEIEIAMLQLLMDKLGSGAVPAVPKVETAAASAVVPAEESVAAINIQLKETAAGKVIQINEPFDRSWRRVGLALDSAHIATTDKDRSTGIYFVAAPQNIDKKNKKPTSDYQVIVHDKHDVSEVSVVDQSGKSDPEAMRIIDMLYRSLTGSAKGGHPTLGDRSGPPPGDAVRPSR